MNNSFQDLGLSKATLDAVARVGFSVPTPVQQQTIPLALAGRDVVAAAKTGTGKTAAFALPTIEKIQHSKRPGSPKALIVSPTRELALQIDEACFALSKNSRHRVLTVVGGVSYNSQINKLKRGVDILVATPGRLWDLMERRVVHLDEVEILVLDEADRMLDMGFWPVMKKIIATTPDSRQTLLFSATIDRKIMQNIEPILKDPAFVEVDHSGETADTIDHYVVPVAHKEKQDLLRAMLKQKGADRSIVFTRTKSRSDSCTRQLRQAGFLADSIHSNKSQAQRKRALDDFSKGKTNILVATDVLARGIDVSQVEQVINYDLPDCPEDYIHRIGRTGRAGEAGYAVSFVSPETKSLLRDIEKMLGEKIPAVKAEDYQPFENVCEPVSASAQVSGEIAVNTHANVKEATGASTNAKNGANKKKSSSSGMRPNKGSGKNFNKSTNKTRGKGKGAGAGRNADRSAATGVDAGRTTTTATGKGKNSLVGRNKTRAADTNSAPNKGTNNSRGKANNKNTAGKSSKSRRGYNQTRVLSA